MAGYIYKIVNKVNGKVYIGKTKRNLHDRFLEHCRHSGSSRTQAMHIKRSILKYGKDNFEIFLVEECPLEELDQKEVYYIRLYKTYDHSIGYNTCVNVQSNNKPLKLNEDEQQRCLELYKQGLSFRNIGKQLNADKATIKHVLEINNIKLRITRSYKFCQEERQQIYEDSLVMSRKEVMQKWSISPSYLSQLINHQRRI